MKRFAPVALLLACVLVPGTALAQSSPAQAEALFNEGKRLMEQSQYAKACAAFEASEKLDHATTTIINLADCREKNEQYATAWGLFLQAAREPRAAMDLANAQLRDVVTKRAAALQPRLSKLTIRVPEASRIAGLEIFRNNDTVDAGAWDTPLPVDGGTYKVSARAPNRREWTTTLTVRVEGDLQVVDVPSLTTSTAAPELVTPPTPRDSKAASLETSPPTSARTDDGPPRRSRVVPIVLIGGAVALGATAIGLAYSGSRVYDDAQSHPDPDRQYELWQSANRRRYAAGAIGALAAASAGVGVYLLVRRTGDGGAIALSPTSAPSFVGLQLDGSW